MKITEADSRHMAIVFCSTIISWSKLVQCYCSRLHSCPIWHRLHNFLLYPVGNLFHSKMFRRSTLYGHRWLGCKVSGKVYSTWKPESLIAFIFLMVCVHMILRHFVQSNGPFLVPLFLIYTLQFLNWYLRRFSGPFCGRWTSRNELHSWIWNKGGLYLSSRACWIVYNKLWLPFFPLTLHSPISRQFSYLTLQGHYAYTILLFDKATFLSSRTFMSNHQPLTFNNSIISCKRRHTVSFTTLLEKRDSKRFMKLAVYHFGRMKDQRRL